MARNLQTFAPGNTTAAKLTPELHELFVNTIRITGRISIASARCAIGVSTARGWMAKGRAEDQGPYRNFFDDVERAKAEYLLLASKQLSRLALGGRVEMPAWDKDGNPVRNHREDCKAQPGTPCGCPLLMCETVLKPESKVLMWSLDRILGTDPQLNGEMEMAPAGMLERPELTEEERQRDARAFYELSREALRIFEDLGVRLQQTLRSMGIETTAQKVDQFMPALPAEPQMIDVAPADEPAKEPEQSKPPKTDPIESF